MDGPSFDLLPNEQANGEVAGDNDANIHLTMMINAFLLTHVVPKHLNLLVGVVAGCADALVEPQIVSLSPPV